MFRPEDQLLTQSVIVPEAGRVDLTPRSTLTLTTPTANPAVRITNVGGDLVATDLTHDLSALELLGG